MNSCCICSILPGLSWYSTCCRCVKNLIGIFFDDGPCKYQVFLFRTSCDVTRIDLIAAGKSSDDPSFPLAAIMSTGEVVPFFVFVKNYPHAVFSILLFGVVSAVGQVSSLMTFCLKITSDPSYVDSFSLISKRTRVLVANDFMGMMA